MNCKSHPLGKVLVAFVIALAALAMPLSAGGPHDPAADPSPARATESRISVTATEDSASIIFPQIADGGGYKTSLLLTNGSATDTMATVQFLFQCRCAPGRDHWRRGLQLLPGSHTGARLGQADNFRHCGLRSCGMVKRHNRSLCFAQRQRDFPVFRRPGPVFGSLRIRRHAGFVRRFLCR